MLFWWVFDWIKLVLLAQIEVFHLSSGGFIGQPNLVKTFLFSDSSNNNNIGLTVWGTWRTSVRKIKSKGNSGEIEGRWQKPVFYMGKEVNHGAHAILVHIRRVNLEEHGTKVEIVR